VSCSFSRLGNQQTGEIVISKSNLISVLEKFKTQNKPVALSKKTTIHCL
jgi:hypothetical protein